MDARAVVIIPARLKSTRLPAKPLAMLAGRPMIAHVAERACRVRGLAEVLVAADSPEVVAAVAGTGARAVMTRPDHASGTDRVAEVAESLTAGVIVNVQGDLPLLDPLMVERLLGRMRDEPSLPMGTLAAAIHEADEWHSPHVVKVVTDATGRALYFSRSPIPHDRDGTRAAGVPLGWRHIGVYAYRREVLLRLAALAPSALEQRERLEQLRALENGIQIGVVEWTPAAPLVEVDTPDDLERARVALEQERPAATRGG